MFENHSLRMAVVEKNILSSLLPSVSLFAAKKISRETQGHGVGQNVIAQQMVLNAQYSDSGLLPVYEAYDRSMPIAAPVPQPCRGNPVFAIFDYASRPDHRRRLSVNSH